MGQKRRLLLCSLVPVVARFLKKDCKKIKLYDPEPASKHATAPDLTSRWWKQRELTCCYSASRTEIGDHHRGIPMWPLVGPVLNTDGEVLIGGDFNNRAVEWTIVQPDCRDQHFGDFSRVGFTVLDIDSTPTYRHPGTMPDVTFATEPLILAVGRSRILEDLTIHVFPHGMLPVYLWVATKEPA